MKRIYVSPDNLPMFDFSYWFTEKSPYHKYSAEVTEEKFNQLTETSNRFLEDQSFLKSLNKNIPLKYEPKVRLSKEDYDAMRSAVIALGYLISDRLKKEFCSSTYIKKANQNYKKAILIVDKNDKII